MDHSETVEWEKAVVIVRLIVTCGGVVKIEG